MYAAKSFVFQFSAVPRASTGDRTSFAPALSVLAARCVLAVGVAFPLLFAAVALPRLASMGQAGERVAAVRPESGAPPVGEHVSRLTVSTPPILVPPARPSATPAAVTDRAADLAAQSDMPPMNAQTYTVQPGDELRHIAAQHGVTIASILALNEVPNPDSLRIGQALRLPNPSP
jgi:cell envelope opacity-associated protein A